MDALVEVHTREEMSVAERIGAEIIGINNRDLHSLEVSLDVSQRLIADRPRGPIMVAESGLSDRGEIQELRELGFDAFLIGEKLMRSDDIISELKNLTENREARYDIS
jgi:indole-3-glycerol phosphate synthase